MQPPAIPADWPNRAASRHILSAPHLWHVQVLGQGPDLLLIHGAGGATHSWRHMISALTSRFRVILVDLPGQGFTVLGARDRCGLEPISRDLSALIAAQGWDPIAVVGHSAGAAIALRLAEQHPLRAVVGLNAALGEFDGIAGWLFPAMAKLLAATPFVAQVFSGIFATPAKTEKLITSTGSTLDPAGLAQYLTLLRRAAHVDATLAMMAQWRLGELLARLPVITTPCLFITSSNDRAVPSETSQRAAARMPAAEWQDIPGFGHLLHEEAADRVTPLILAFLIRVGTV